MLIKAESVFKRFHQKWIIKSFNYEFESNKIYGISGLNGSGKTTLLKMLAGFIPVTKGKISYNDDGLLISTTEWFRYLSYAAPYADLFEYMNLNELFHHHVSFKKMRGDISRNEFIELVNLKGHEEKLLKKYSSGMRQRLKLGLMILSDCPVLFLDEPQSNLDEYAKDWYQKLLMANAKDRLIIIASNEPDDFKYANEIIPVNTD